MEWHDKMACSWLYQHEATFSLWQVIFQKLNYPLLATTFNPEQCKSIMALILKCSLPSARIVRTYPCPLVHGPSQYTGLNIPNLHMEQTILHIIQILCLPNVDNVTAFLLHTCSKSMRLELGWAGEVFDAPIIIQHAITPSWIKHVWLTSRSLDICIHMGIFCLPPRQGDIEIMRLFLQHGFCEPDTLLSLNQCQMYLHAFWVADLCTGSGHLTPYGSGEDHTPCNSPWQWPKMIKPLPSDWQNWQLTLTASLHLSQDKCLAQPLGPWLISYPYSSQMVF